MAKKAASLTDKLMPVDEQAAIPARVIVPESQNARKPEPAAEPLVGLNFKVRTSFRREFKIWCATHDTALVDALAEAFELLRNKYR